MPQQPKQILTEQIARVRNITRVKLARFSRLDASECKEVYLFQSDQFCGIRFTLGAFQAEWRIAESRILISRESNQIEQVELEPTSENRAA